MNEEFILKIVVDDGEFIVKLPDTEKRVKSLGQAFDVAKEKTKAYSKETEIAAKKNIDLTSNAGLAGATLTELGRTISDLPFGIRGVANNLSQLSTLFITLVAKSSDGGKSLKGVGEAFKLLKNQLLGPLGIILVFQSVIALLDFFSQKSKKAASAADLFTDAADRQAKTLSVLESQLKDTNLSLENRQALLEAATVASSRLSKILDDETLSIEERNKKAERFLELEIERLKRQSLIEKAEEDLAAAREASTKAIENENKGLEDFVQNTFKGITPLQIQAQQTAFLNKKKRESKDATDAVAVAETALTTLLIGNAKIIKEQSDLLETNTENKKDNKKVTGELNALELEGLNFFTVKAEAEQQLMEIQKDRRKIEFQDIRTNLSEDITALKLRTKSREEFERKKIDLILDAMRAEIKSIQMSLDTDRLTVEERLKLRERLAILTTQVAETEDEKLRVTLAKIKEFVGTMTSLISDFNDAELSAAERNTVLLNNQLKDRLKNERLSAKEREHRNAQIALNQEKLQKKRDEIALRNFRLQKAFAISTALINTFLAVSEALPNIPKAIAVGVLGAAQVAAILSTKFVPSANSVPSGSAGVGLGRGTAEAQDPAFNIVGTGQQFQLAQVIAQRTGEPIRAFVVSGDVRTGLALDRNIINSSKIN